MHTLHMLDILPLIDIAQPPPGAKNYNIPCPCCDHAPRKRHLNINLEKDVFRCPRCGFSGGIFDLYSYYTGTPRHGAYSTLLSRLPFSTNNLPKQPVASNEASLCPIEQRNETYQALLSHLSLASDHWKSLLSRGLSPEEILRLGYKTTSSGNTKLLASHLLSNGYCLQGVPGFYQTAAGWTLIPQQRGILIPVRDLHGRIQGLQIRCDSTSHRKFRWLSSINRKSGCKAESWVHMSGAPKDMVLLTEGAMKADIIHAFTGQTVLAVAGINALSHLEEVLENLQQRGTRKIMIAFDMDFLSNPHVQTGYCHLTELLSNLGFCYGTYLWDPHYKGLDDYLQNFRPNSFPTPVAPPCFRQYSIKSNLWCDSTTAGFFRLHSLLLTIKVEGSETMNYRALGKNIRKYRQEKGLNQEELAELVGCTSSHIGQIENARGIPSLEMTVRIANALCVSIDLLVLESLHHPEIIHLHDVEKQLKQFPASTKHAVCAMIRDLIKLVEKLPGSQSADNYSAYDFHI